MLNQTEKTFLDRAIELSRQGMENGNGGPFGCVVVLNGEIIGEGCNMVTSTNDPTAHAEVVAIRQACNKLGSYQLTDCEIYTSCEPCPMCLGAIYWARPRRVLFANTRQDAAAIEFDDDFIYHEINTTLADRQIPFLHYPHPGAKAVFERWKEWEGKKLY
jgi:tRNA(Arg) A34 adenosine deaminase TadA